MGTTGSIILADNDHADRDLALTGRVGEVLARHYQGYTWGVSVDTRGGVIVIHCGDLSGTHGYVIKLKGTFSWDSLRDAVKQAGGEILERYNLPRSRKDLDKWRALPRAFTGLPKGELA